jgi:hypothetical protein
MADYYTQFSAEIKDLSHQEKDWLKKYLTPPTNDELGDEALMKKWHEERDNPYTTFDNDPELWPHFEWFTEKNLWIYSEDSGLVEAVEVVVRRFLQKFRPQDYFAMEWAATCSKPRTNGFGGGAIFVTAEDSRWTSSCQWISEQIAEVSRG